MALDPALEHELHNDEWFHTHPAAWSILTETKQLITTAKTPVHNLQSLLSNLCEYGATRWQYEPGSPTNADRVLRGMMTMTDCSSLADMFVLLVQYLDPALGFGVVTKRKIARDKHRIVTKPGLVTFNGKSSDAAFEGRWCFGDHYVAECQGLCYDPTFKIPSFSFAQAPQVDWYALEEVDGSVYCRRIWTSAGKRTVYMKRNADYTFDRNQAK